MAEPIELRVDFVAVAPRIDVSADLGRERQAGRRAKAIAADVTREGRYSSATRVTSASCSGRPER